jgi:hypothetical protein
MAERVSAKELAQVLSLNDQPLEIRAAYLDSQPRLLGWEDYDRLTQMSAPQLARLLKQRLSDRERGLAESVLKATLEDGLMVNQFESVDGLDSKTPRPHWKQPGLGMRSA